MTHYIYGKLLMHKFQLVPENLWEISGISQGFANDGIAIGPFISTIQLTIVNYYYYSMAMTTGQDCDNKDMTRDTVLTTIRAEVGPLCPSSMVSLLFIYNTLHSILITLQQKSPPLPPVVTKIAKLPPALLTCRIHRNTKHHKKAAKRSKASVHCWCFFLFRSSICPNQPSSLYRNGKVVRGLVLLCRLGCSLPTPCLSHGIYHLSS